jgi:hypothetical protein
MVRRVEPYCGDTVLSEQAADFDGVHELVMWTGLALRL